MCCHLCNLEVPPGEAHDKTLMHRAAQLIAVTALDRVRSQAFPDTDGTGVFMFSVPAPNPAPTQPQAVPTTFSFGSLTKEPSPPSPFAMNITGNSAIINTPGSKVIFPAEFATKPSFMGPVFATNKIGNSATTNTPDSKPLFPVEFATKPSFKGPVFATNKSGNSATTNTPDSKPLFPAEFATKPSFKGAFGINITVNCATTNTPGSKSLMPAEITTIPSNFPAFATNKSGNCSTTSTPGSKPLFPAEFSTKPSFKDPAFATNITGNCAKTSTPRSKSLMPAEIATIPFKNVFATNISGNCTTTNTPGSKPLMSAEIATVPSFKAPVFGTSLGVNDFEWCDYCQQLVAARAHVTHQRSKLHIDAAYQDQMFMEAVQSYVDEEDLKILEGSSTDGVQLDPFIPGNKLYKVYNCETCDTHFVPVEFKKQHEDSIRHRACLALTAAACRRLRRHLASGAPAQTPGAPGASSDAPAPRTTTMRDLLYAYRYPPTRIKNNPQPLQPHLPLKNYINRISTRLERIKNEPGSYTMIVTDESVIIKTAVIMAVDWPMYLGVRAHGDGDYTECCACGGIFKNIEGHLETAKHVKYVLSPIDEQGIRQIDSTDSMCLLCGDKIWSFDVDAHINEERHIKNRAIALNRGNMYTEAKEDLKLHLILETGTIRIVSEESTGEKPESEVIRNGDETIAGDQGTVNTEAGDHALPSDT